MPNLRDNEHIKVCESPYCTRTTGGNRAGKPRPYVVRSYYHGIEKKWCQTCCDIGVITGELQTVFKDGVKDGYKKLSIGKP